MSDETRLTIVGRLAADPELRYTPSGAAVVSFRIISTARRQDKESGRWVDGASVSYQCDAWRQLAENIAESLAKGSLVIATGRLEERSYEARDGATRYVIELKVEHIGPSLQWDKVKILKAERTSASGGRPADDDPWATGQAAARAPRDRDEPDF